MRFVNTVQFPPAFSVRRAACSCEARSTQQSSRFRGRHNAEFRSCPARTIRWARTTKISRFHDLRHTFSVLALQNGVDVKTLSAILGHYSAGFTLDTYAHVTTSMQKQAANAVGNFLSGTLQP